MRFFSRLLLGLYFIEAGIILIYAPWTTWWSRNYFAQISPGMRDAMASSAARIFVAAAGVMTVLAGMIELRRALASRFGRRAQGQGRA